MNVLNIILLIIMLIIVTILIVSIFFPIVLKPSDYCVWRLLKNDTLVIREHYDYIDDASLIKEVWIAVFVEHPDYYAFCYSEKFSTEIKLGVFKNSDSSLSITSFYKVQASKIIKKVLSAYVEYVNSTNEKLQETDTDKIEENAE